METATDIDNSSRYNSPVFYCFFKSFFFQSIECLRRLPAKGSVLEFRAPSQPAAAIDDHAEAEQSDVLLLNHIQF